MIYVTSANLCCISVEDVCKLMSNLAYIMNGRYGVYKDGQLVCGTIEPHECESGYIERCGEATYMVVKFYSSEYTAYLVV